MMKAKDQSRQEGTAGVQSGTAGVQSVTVGVQSVTVDSRDCGAELAELALRPLILISSVDHRRISVPDYAVRASATHS